MNMDNNAVVDSDYAAMDHILHEKQRYTLNMCKKIKKSRAIVMLIQKGIFCDAYIVLSTSLPRWGFWSLPTSNKPVSNSSAAP